MHTLIFLLATAPQSLTISHCPEALIEKIRAAAGDVSATIVCDEHSVLVDAGDTQTVLKRVDDDTLLARILKKLPAPRPPAAASEPSASQPSVDKAPRGPDDKIEVWIQPLMSTVMAVSDAALGGGNGALRSGNYIYVSGGVTTRFRPDWELVTGISVATGDASSDGTDAVFGWQLWLSAAPVHFWHFSGKAPRTGFFVGPKLTVEVAHLNAYGESPVGPRIPSVTSLSLEVGVEAGLRFQFSHFALTISLPSVDFGYGWNQPGIVSMFASSATVGGFAPQSGANGIAVDFNLNLLRFGASF